MQLPKYLPKSQFFTAEDLPLFEVTSTFAYCQVLKKLKMDKAIATFDLYVRDMPKNRNFLLFGGLEEIITHILQWRFNDNQIKVLLKQGVIGPELAGYLKKFKFRGSVHAMKEGTVFFPGEPIVRVTAPIIDANLFYVLLLNAVASHTVFLSKTVRSVLAAKDKIVVTNGGRALGFEIGAKYVRSAYITGCRTSLQFSPLLKYKIPLPDKCLKASFHAYIKSFPSEYEAFKALVDQFPNFEVSLMIDTYDFDKGLENAIEICRYLKKKKKGIAAIFIDSGDLKARCRLVRRKMDRAGFSNVKILVASNMDEWKIREFIDKGVPCDIFMAITELVTSADDPKLEIVYKMAEITNNGVTRPTMKFATGKLSLPGVKQIYRLSKNGIYCGDTIGIVGEKIGGKPLLIPVIVRGKLVYKLPKLDAIRSYVKEELAKLPAEFKKLYPPPRKYPISISSGLRKIIRVVKKAHFGH